jgi:hypothetical protein
MMAGEPSSLPRKIQSYKLKHCNTAAAQKNPFSNYMKDAVLLVLSIINIHFCFEHYKLSQSSSSLDFSSSMLSYKHVISGSLTLQMFFLLVAQY